MHFENFMKFFFSFYFFMQIRARVSSLKNSSSKSRFHGTLYARKLKSKKYRLGMGARGERSPWILRNFFVVRNVKFDESDIKKFAFGTLFYFDENLHSEGSKFKVVHRILFCNGNDDINLSISNFSLELVDSFYMKMLIKNPRFRAALA